MRITSHFSLNRFPATLLLSVFFITGAFAGTSTEYVLQITKSIHREFTRTYTWELEKNCLGPNPLVLSSGQKYEYEFEWIATPSYEDSEFEVFGEISITNPAPIPVLILSVTDLVTPGNYAATVDCGVSFPFLLESGGTLGCPYTISMPDAQPITYTNTATVESSISGIQGASYSVNFTFNNPTKWVDAGGAVWDNCGGEYAYQAQVEFETTTYKYKCTVGPYEECGPYEFTNSIFLLPNTSLEDNPVFAECTIDIEIPCGGCTRTIGYWKTHSSYGPAPYDPTWAKVGEDAPFFLSGQSYYEVMWTPSKGNAYYILAPQYVAAKLNQLAGTDIPPAVLSAYTMATTLLSTYTPAYIGGLKGNSSLRKKFLALASILDDYNNGLLGPGHCDEGSSDDEEEKEEGDSKSPGLLLTTWQDELNEEIQVRANPNPFVDEVQFTFSIPYDTRVTLDLYNAGGQKITTVFNGDLEGGQQYAATFQAGQLPQGLYIYRLTTDHEVKTGQLVSLK